MIEAYPLCWPPGWPRTKSVQHSRFGSHTLSTAIREVLNELNLLGVSSNNVIISTNLRLRNDGLPKSGQRQPDDRGVVIYFRLNGNQQCMPCDKWSYIEDNLWAIKLCIGALRGLERWGAKEMVNAAFTGFKAIPMQILCRPWYEVLGILDTATPEEIKAARNELAGIYHPDKPGGDVAKMAEINQAFEHASQIIQW